MWSPIKSRDELEAMFVEDEWDWAYAHPSVAQHWLEVPDAEEETVGQIKRNWMRTGALPITLHCHPYGEPCQDHRHRYFREVTP